MSFRYRCTECGDVVEAFQARAMAGGHVQSAGHACNGTWERIEVTDGHDRSWHALPRHDRDRFLLILEGMRRGAVKQEASTRCTEFDVFMLRAITAAMAELRKADES